MTRDPDLAAVDVQNRVNQALGRLPGEVRQTGVTGAEGRDELRAWAPACSPESGAYDSLFLSNYIDVYVKDALKRVPGVAEVVIFGERKYSMRLWLDPVAARGAPAHGGRRGQRAARAERQRRRRAASARRRRANRADLPDQRARGGPPARGARSSRTSSSRPAATASLDPRRRRRLGRTRRRNLPSTLRFNGFDAVGFGVIALPVRQRPRRRAGGRRRARAPEDQRSRRGCSTGWRSTPPRSMEESISEVLKTLGEAILPRHPRDVPLPPELAGDDHPDAHAAGVAHRRVRVRQAPRLLDQHAHAVRHRARHGHRRRRRDRGDREHRASHPGARARRRAGPRPTRCARCSVPSSRRRWC